MPVQRVLPDDERIRRNFGGSLAATCLAALGWLGWAIAQGGGINLPTLILIAIPAGLAYLGLRLALKRKLVLLIDAGARTVVRVERGVAREPRPLDELAPLAVTLRQREVKTKNGTRTITRYGVQTRDGVDLREVAAPAAARRQLERFARAWRLDSRFLDGDVRRADDLDRPLHERRRGQRRDGPGLRPEWRLEVRPLSPGYAIVSRHRSWTPLAHAGMITGGAGIMVGMIAFSGIREVIRARTETDLHDVVFLGLLGVVLLALLWQVVKGARDTFHPGTLRITPDGVSYRGTRLRLHEVEEVLAHGGIDIVGDRRTITVPSFFYPLPATEALACEVTNRIVEMGPYAPPR